MKNSTGQKGRKVDLSLVLMIIPVMCNSELAGVLDVGLSVGESQIERFKTVVGQIMCSLACDLIVFRLISIGSIY